MGFVVGMLRAVLIVSAATTFSMYSGSRSHGLSHWLSVDLSNSITWLITGRFDSASKMIDHGLGYMQIALSSIDQLDVGNSDVVQDYKTRNMWFTGIGMAGPAVTGGALLLLNRLAMALFIGLGPIFILCLLFDQTKQLFQKWLYYGIGTMFSLAVMSAMVSIAMDATLAVAEAFWVGKFLGTNSEGINSMALQQGGLGLLMTMLIISAPPMAAQFFQGVIAQFNPYPAFGSDAGRPGSRGNAGSGHMSYATPDSGSRQGDQAARSNGGAHAHVVPRQSSGDASLDVIKKGTGPGAVK